MKWSSRIVVAVAALLVPAAANYTLPLVDAKSYEATVDESRLFAHAQQLLDWAYSTKDRNRNINTYGHNKTVDYLYNTLSSLGYYHVEKQPFRTGLTVGNSSLTVNGSPVIPADLFDYTGSGNVTAPMVVVDNLGCNLTDFPANITGNIALIQRGTCNLGLKCAYVGGLGGAGCVIWNDIEGSLANRTFVTPWRPEGPYPPSVGTTNEVGIALRDRILGGENLTAHLDVDANNYNITVNNVIATTLGGDQDNVYQMGGPGIDDDGSGIITLLELAIQLSNYTVNNAIRFSFWAAEEEGSVGSTYYTTSASNSTLSKIRLYNNFDMIASPNFVYAVMDGDGSAFNISGPPGSAAAEKMFVDYFADQGLETVPTILDGRSDYVGFSDVGIPVGGLFTGAEGIKTAEEQKQFGGEAGIAYDPNYHSAGDNVANCNATAWVVNSKAIAYSIAKYGTSWEGMPERGAAAQKSFLQHSFLAEKPVGKTWGHIGIGKKTPIWM